MISSIKLLEAGLYLAIVLGAIAAIAFIARYILQRRGYSLPGTSKDTLRIVEKLYLDQRRYVIRLQDKECSYLLLLGANTELLLNVDDSKQDV